MAEVVAKYKLDVNDAVKNLDKLQKETKGLDKDLDKAGKDGEKSLGRIGKATGGLGNKFKDLGRQIVSALAIGSAVTAFISAIRGAIRINKDFELQMARVQAITGATSKEFKLLGENAKRLGSSTKFTATQVGELQEEYAKLGFTTKEILNATEATLELAEATGGSLSEAANVTGQVLRSFGLEATETQRVVDVMAASFTKSALNISSFQESMKFAAPIARAAGIEIETVTALLGKLADSGLRGSIAGTGLKNLLSQLANENSDLGKEIGFAVKNTDDLFRAFNKLKDSNIDLTKATELTDERSKAAFITLIEGIGSVEELTAALNDSAGAASDMAKIMRDTLSGDVDRMKSAIEGLALALGEGEGGLAQAARRATQNWTMWIGKLAEAALSTQQLIDQKADTYYEKYAASILDSGDSIDELIKKQRERLISATEDAMALRDQDRLTGDLLITRLGEIKGLQAIIALLEEKRKASQQDNGETENGTESTDNYVRSIGQLNKELKKLQSSFKDAEIGSQEWIDLIGKAEEKTQELDKALLKAQARLVMFQQSQRGFDPFETEGDEDPSFSLDGLLSETKEIGDDYVEETENVTSIADDLWNRHFNDLMLNAEKSRSQNKENFEESLNEWNTYLQAVSGLGEAFGQIQSAITEGQLKELDTQLQQGLISREEYDIKRRRILKQQAEDQKAVAIFDATINGFAAVVSAYNVDPTGILAGITAAIVAAQVAAIAAQPIPEFAKGVIDLKGKGTETSDDIPAMLSRGESVMTARETRTYKDELLAIRKGGFEQLILTKYVKPMIDKSLFNGFGDIGKSARLNGITANLKDHNILHGLDRLRQSQTQGFQFLAKELKQSQPKRGGYRA